MCADQQVEAADTATSANNQDVEPKDLLVEFTVTASWNDINKEIDNVVLKHSTNVKMPGFHQGKVPLDVVRAHYKEALTDEAVNNVINKQVVEKIRTDKLKVLSNPTVKKLDFEEGKDLSADIVLEVFPEVEVPELENLVVEVGKKEMQIEPYDEEKQIDALLEGNQKRVPLQDRALQEGDWVMTQIQSRLMDSKRLTPKKELPLLIKEDQDQEIKDLVKNLLGKRVEEEFTIKAKYDKAYKKKAWAGKDIEHYVKIQKAFEMVKPEFNADFLKSIGYEDGEVLKKKLKEDYEKYQQEVNEDKKIKLLIEKLNDTIKFNVPQSLVEQEMIRINSKEGQMMQITNDQQKEEYLANLKQKAENSIKFTLIMDAVEKKYDIKVPSDEIQEEMKKIADANKVDVVKVRQYYSNAEKRKELEDSLIRMKVMDFMKEKISFKEV